MIQGHGPEVDYVKALVLKEENFGPSRRGNDGCEILTFELCFGSRIKRENHGSWSFMKYGSLFERFLVQEWVLGITDSGM